MRIKRFGVLSTGKVFGILYAAMGLIFGAMLLPFMMLSAAFGNQSSMLAAGLFSLAMIVLLPLFYGVMGFLSGVLMAWIYNVTASYVGGIEVEVQK